MDGFNKKRGVVREISPLCRPKALGRWFFILGRYFSLSLSEELAVNSTQKVFVRYASSPNEPSLSRDDGYPSGGNYWSSYNGTDVYSGPYQNETGSDGIGDTSYIINENNRDNYPFVRPLSISTLFLHQYHFIPSRTFLIRRISLL
jgi:hypothetical protein